MTRMLFNYTKEYKRKKEMLFRFFMVLTKSWYNHLTKIAQKRKENCKPTLLIKIDEKIPRKIEQMGSKRLNSQKMEAA